MANKHSSIVELFTAIANALRLKGETSDPIVADTFPDVIAALPSGRTTILPLSVTSNGTYTAPSGSAYSPVTVNVPTLDTSDANASAENILSGKTAYVNGVKITGTAAVRVEGTTLYMPEGLVIPNA